MVQIEPFFNEFLEGLTYMVKRKDGHLGVSSSVQQDVGVVLKKNKISEIIKSSR